MAEYIEREKVLELMGSMSRDIEDVPENAFPKDYAEGWEDGLETAADKVECLFAADVRPERHGRWITRHKGLPFCSECDYNGLGYIAVDLDYCPKCGAKMTGGE